MSAVAKGMSFSFAGCGTLNAGSAFTFRGRLRPPQF